MNKHVSQWQPIVTSFAIAIACLATVCTVFGQETKRIKPTLTFDIKEPGVSVGGIASDGESLWISAQSVSNPDVILRYSFEGKLLKRIPLPGAGNIGGGLAHDGKCLYVLDYRNRIATRKGTLTTGRGAVYRLHGEELKKIADIPEEQSNTFGLTHMNGILYYGHSPTVRPKSTINSINSEFKLSNSTKVALYVRGLASDGRSLWCSSIKRVHRLDDQFHVLGAFTPSVPLADLACSDGSLWAIEHNKNRVHRFTIVFDQSK